MDGLSEQQAVDLIDAEIIEELDAHGDEVMELTEAERDDSQEGEENEDDEDEEDEDEDGEDEYAEDDEQELDIDLDVETEDLQVKIEEEQTKVPESVEAMDSLKSEPDVEEDEKKRSIDLDGKPEDALPDDIDDGDEEERNGNHGLKRKSVSDRTQRKEEEKSREKFSGRDSSNSDPFGDPLTKPPQGSEVFIGGISRDTTEEDIREVCSPFGEIYEIRIMKDRETGYSKGYAFLTYRTREEATKALESMPEVELKGKIVRLSHSQPKNRLFVGNVPRQWEKQDLQKALIADAKAPGIVNVELLKDPRDPLRNRGFAFIEFYNHSCADTCRRNASAPGFRLGGFVPTVTWAEPRPETDSSALSNVKVVYVKGIPETATEENLSALFEKYGEVTEVVIPAPKAGLPKRDFAFVHFAERSQALKATEKDEKLELDGNSLQASLARPQSEKRPYPEHHSGNDHRGHSSGYSSRSHGYGNDSSYSSSRSNYSSRSGGGDSGYDRVAHGIQGVQVQAPLIYGRGPVPSGMTMVPMLLPDGRVGYVFQPGPVVGPVGGSSRSYNANRDSGRSGSRVGPGSGAGISGSAPSGYHGNSQGRRYRPY